MTSLLRKSILPSMILDMLLSISNTRCSRLAEMDNQQNIALSVQQLQLGCAYFLHL